MRKRRKAPLRNLEYYALQALDKGIPESEMRGNVRIYLSELHFSHRESGEIRIFILNNFVWIFNLEDKLITCYPMLQQYRSELRRHLIKLEKRRRREARKARYAQQAK